MLTSVALMSYIPHITTPPILLVIFFLNQVPFGMFETGSNMFIMLLWGNEMTPFMQSLHFLFGVGATLAPVIAVPFLVEVDDDDSVNGTTTTTASPILHEGSSNLTWPYSIVAAVIFCVGIFFLIVWRLYPHTSPHPSSLAITSITDDQVVSGKRSNGNVNNSDCNNSCWAGFWRAIVVMLACMFMHVFHGLEITFGNYLTPFVVNSRLHLTKAAGAHLTTLYWSCFSLFRIATVFYIGFIGNEWNITGSLVAILIANIFLVPFGQTSQIMLWIGVALIGIGTSSVWACAFGFMQDNIKLTSTISALMVVCANMGEFVFPFLISFFIKDYPMILLWVTLFLSVSVTLLFAFMSLICRQLLK